MLGDIGTYEKAFSGNLLQYREPPEYRGGAYSKCWRLPKLFGASRVPKSLKTGRGTINQRKQFLGFDRIDTTKKKGPDSWDTGNAITNAYTSFSNTELLLVKNYNHG